MCVTASKVKESRMWILTKRALDIYSECALPGGTWQARACSSIIDAVDLECGTFNPRI
jgi:hypothetical protein